MFEFFLKSYRCGILDFCGVEVNVKYDIDEVSGKEGFRMYDNGLFKHKDIISKHSNILKGVIIGKKSWGLWVNEWSDGIVDWTFTLGEILEQFKENNIEIPKPLYDDFLNRIEKKKRIRNELYLKELKNK
jgi:hypothetical protein